MAAEAGADRLVLTHLWPGTNPAAVSYDGEIAVAIPGLLVPV